MDTEGEGRAGELAKAEELAAKNEVEIVYSSPAIEYWLLCHFEKASRAHLKDCEEVIKHLNPKWQTIANGEYGKSDSKVYERLGDRLETARTQALETDLFHISLHTQHRKVNPSTQIYELLGMLLGVQTGAKCPKEGDWKLVGDSKIATNRAKGDTMPDYQGLPSTWFL